MSPVGGCDLTHFTSTKHCAGIQTGIGDGRFWRFRWPATDATLARRPQAARGLDLRDTVKIASERWQKRVFRGQKCQKTDFFEKFRVGRKFCELFEKVTFFSKSRRFSTFLAAFRRRKRPNHCIAPIFRRVFLGFLKHRRIFATFFRYTVT